MKTKIAILILLVVFVSSIVAHAWIPVVLRGAATIATSAAARRVACSVGLSLVRAGSVVRNAAVTQGAKKIAFKVGNTAAAALGISYLVSDFSDLYDWVLEQTGVLNPGSFGEDENGNNICDVYEINGVTYQISTIGPAGSAKIYRATACTVNTSAAGTPLNVTVTGGYEPTVNTDYYGLRWRANSGSGWGEYTGFQGAYYSLSPSVSINNQSGYTMTEPEPEQVLDEDELQAVVAANPLKWLDTEYVETSLESDLPQDALLLPDLATATVTEEPYYDPVNETYTDLETGMDQTPVEDLEYGTYSPPAQVEPPMFDTLIDAPVKESIPELIESWLSNAPFATFFEQVELNTSGSQSVFQIETPFGTTGTMNFSNFASLWAQISSIIIGFAYIYAMWIFFTGAA